MTGRLHAGAMSFGVSARGVTRPINRPILPLILPLILVATWLLASSAAAGSIQRGALGPPPGAPEVTVVEKIGQSIPTNLVFTDQDHRPVPMAALFAGNRPVLLTLAYYRCPMLCDLVLRGLAQSLSRLGWLPGRDYQAVTVSIDPKDRPGAARVKQIGLLQAIGQPAAAAGWPFLVGAAPDVRRLADAVGFQYVYDPSSDQYAHPAVAMVITPGGRVSRYLYGVAFRPLDVRLALTEAAGGHVGGVAERILLTCFRYDPATRRYGFFVSAVIKGGGALVLAAAALGLFALIRYDRRRQRQTPEQEAARSPDLARARGARS